MLADEDSRFLQNVSKYLSNYKTPQPRRFVILIIYGKFRLLAVSRSLGLGFLYDYKL